MDFVDRRLILAGAGLAGVAALSKLAKAGPLDPPSGPVASTGKTLQEICDKIARTDVGFAEPRIPVQSLPGSATAVHVITQPGSYYLTGNILGQPGKNGVEILADDVSLDLTGFTIKGVPGAVSGVNTVDFREHPRVFNGVVRNWPDAGVRLRSIFRHSIVHDLHALDNGNVGIQCEWQAFVQRCTVTGGSTGFLGQEGSHFRECIARFCGRGFSVSFETEVSACQATVCSTGVFNFFGRAHINNCYISRCPIGIEIETSSPGASVISNVVEECETVGVRVPESGQVFLAKNVVGRVGALGVGYSIAPGNSHGPIVNVAGVGDISAVPNANHPWANFVF